MAMPPSKVSGGTPPMACVWLDRPISPASLGLFRVLLGLTLIGASDKVWNNKEKWHWGLEHGQIFFLKYRFFFWLPEPGTELTSGWRLPGLESLSHVLRISAAFIAAGVLVRLAALVYLLVYVFAFLAEASLYNNHYYFTILLLIGLCITDTGHWCSFGHAWCAVRGRAVARVGVWQLLTFHVQIFILYFFGGIWKLSSDWLLHCHPLRVWVRQPGAIKLEWLDVFGTIGRWLLQWVVSDPLGPCLMSWASCFIDLFLPFPLFGWVPFRRGRGTLRFLSAVVVIAFHAVNLNMFDIGSFPFIMMSTTVLALHPEVPERGLGKLMSLLGACQRSEPGSAGSSQAQVKVRSAPWFFLLLLATWNVVVPLRHLLWIDGPVETSQEGNDFAWRMKLFERKGNVTWNGFRVHVDGQLAFRVPLEHLRFISPRQITWCSRTPEYFWQCAEFLGKHFMKSRHVSRERLQIFGDMELAYNHRPYVRVVDPHVDLLRAPMPLFAHAPWISPPPSEYLAAPPGNPYASNKGHSRREAGGEVGGRKMTEKRNKKASQEL